MLTNEVLRSAAAQIVTSSEGDICDMTRRVVAFAKPSWEHHERRRFKRHPYPMLIRIMPVADDELVPVDEPITVVGKQLSLLGLDFYHNQPLPYRRVIVSLEHGHGLFAQYVLSVSWCRFIQAGWYDSGGRFTDICRWPEETAS